MKRYASPLVAFTLLASLTACNGGGDNTETSSGSSASVPGVPTNLAATPGNAAISLSFSTPASDGGSPITGYSASCSNAGGSASASGSGSPLNVSGLTNGSSYSCSVIASNVIGSSAPSSSVTATPSAAISAAGSSTAGVLCALSYNAYNASASVQTSSVASWSCNASSRLLTANGIPDHAVGTFPNADNPNTITPQNISVSYSLAPVVTSSSGTPTQIIGYALNGVKMDPNTGGTCDSSGNNCSLIGGNGAWRMEALGQNSFRFGTDANNAHVQPNGEYHYHGMPEGLISKQAKGAAMTLVGWAADGFPIYARYGYNTATDASSGIKTMKGSYQLKSTPDAGRPSTSTYAMGTFQQDYQYVAGSGDLDECNGRTGVTPEFPAGIYHYYITDSYPYIQRCVKGTAAINANGGLPPRP